MFFDGHGITIDSTGVRSGELSLAWPEIHSYGSLGLGDRVTVDLNSMPLMTTTKQEADEIMFAISAGIRARQVS
jgi:hypothetical protein